MKPLFTLALASTLYFTGFAQQRNLFISSTSGGSNNLGAIYMADSSGTDFHLVYNCDTTGSRIIGGLTQAPNGVLYGVTETGGYADSCVVCRYDPVTGVFTNIHNFAMNIDSGEMAQSGMTLGSDGQLYGTTYYGGNYGAGVIYTVNPTTNSYSPIHHFDTIGGTRPMNPLLQANDGKFYGTTDAGGTNDAGTIYSFNPVNQVFETLYSFDSTVGGVSSIARLVQATDGKLYGTTYRGGANDFGTIYSFDINTNTFADIFDFSYAIGNSPAGGLVQNTDGLLYGTTNSGGANYYGVIYKFDPVSYTYTTLFNFDGANGAQPQRELTLTGNGKLFGITVGSGTYNTGVVYSYDIPTSAYTKLYEFDSLSGYSQGDVSVAVLSQVGTGISGVDNTTLLSIYPNPAAAVLEIKVDATLTGSFAGVTDVTGRQVTGLALNNQTTELNTQNIPDGIYYITVRKGNSTHVQKLVVAH